MMLSTEDPFPCAVRSKAHAYRRRDVWSSRETLGPATAPATPPTPAPIGPATAAPATLPAPANLGSVLVQATGRTPAPARQGQRPFGSGQISVAVPIQPQTRRDGGKFDFCYDPQSCRHGNSGRIIGSGRPSTSRRPQARCVSTETHRAPVAWVFACFSRKAGSQPSAACSRRAFRRPWACLGRGPSSPVQPTNRGPSAAAMRRTAARLRAMGHGARPRLRHR